ncbi:MAG: hypothetical protein ACXV2C_05725, partial [Candidatus Bathyarchaeia archaeon]
MLACWHRGGLSCLIILLGTLALLAFFSQASANFIPPYDHHIGIYIKADGSIEPASAPIHRFG